VDGNGGEPELMKGGLSEVIRIGATVIRPTGFHSASVHSLLRHLESVGFDGAPRFISVDADHGTETVSFLDGETTDYPLADSFRTDRAMISAARLLRRLHDATT
jgi:hypothetical protein